VKTCLFDSKGETEIEHIGLPEYIDRIFHGWLPGTDLRLSRAWPLRARCRPSLQP
jgi:hypothetical protein